MTPTPLVEIHRYVHAYILLAFVFECTVSFDNDGSVFLVPPGNFLSGLFAIPFSLLVVDGQLIDISEAFIRYVTSFLSNCEFEARLLCEGRVHQQRRQVINNQSSKQASRCILGFFVACQRSWKRTLHPSQRGTMIEVAADSLINARGAQSSVALDGCRRSSS